MKTIFQKLHTLLCVVMLCANGTGVAQYYEVGDRLPGMVFRDVYNTSGDVSLEKGRAKLTILDFWATNCKSCLEGFAKIDSLQAMFGDDVRFLLVGAEPADSLARFFQRRKLVKPRVPFITSDTVLTNLFFHEGVPFHVWLDDELRVVIMTSGGNTDATTIQPFLEGKSLSFGKHVSGKASVEPVWNVAYEDKMRFFSSLTNCIPGTSSAFPDSLRETLTGLTRRCMSAVELFLSAYGENGQFDYSRPGRLETRFANASAYVRPSDRSTIQDWISKYSYNYVLKIPVHKAPEMFALMRRDLEFYFSLKSGIEKRQRNAIVLTRLSGLNKVATRGDTPKNTFSRSGLSRLVEDSVRQLINQPFTRFSNDLGKWLERKYNLPYVDDTGLSGNIDISIPGPVLEELDIEAMNKALSRYDLALKEMPFLIDVLVLSE